MPAMPSLSPPHPVGHSSTRPHGRSRGRSWAPALLLASLVGACGPGDNQFPPVCPTLGLLPDAADVTRFNGGGQDVTDMLVRARITGVPAKCDMAEPGSLRATLHVDADLFRGPVAAAASPPIGYFVAVMKAGTVLQEQDFAFTPTFAPNVDRSSVHGEDIELLLPVGKSKSAAAYRIYVGFRLTPTELAYNRAHPRP